jgi:hypothetical protein
MIRLALEWDTALLKYVSTCELGGTPDERKWAWANANHALDQLLAHEHAELKARAQHQTEELEAA